MKTIIITILLASTATISWIGFGNSDAKVIENEIQKTLQTSGADSGQLKQLVITGKELEKLDQLRNITTVEDLNLSDNQIEDLTPLSQLEKLIVLDLSKNQITDLSPLSGLNGLRYLNLNQNQVESLEPLRPISELVGLILTGNQNVDLSPLKGMKNLRSLYLSPGPNLTQRDYDQIHQALPDCTITIVSYVD
jgi:internalin A